MKTKVLFLCVIALFVLLLTGCSTNPTPKYVFLFIGDGMGKPHVDLARKMYGPLNMDSLPVRGSVSTVNIQHTVTDSAASGTAYACGVKTQNGRLGIDAEGNKVDSCAVLAKRQGRQVAILTTVGANNATPAAFYAHVARRGESKTIMAQYPEAKFDILAGSGIDGMRSDVKQEDFLSGKAYQMGDGNTEKEEFSSATIRVFARDDSGFFALKKLEQPVFVYSSGTDNLAGYVQKSIDLMSGSPRGFFMMAEGGHIDHGGHGNNVTYMLSELMKFDKAVAVALQFYQKHPKETLIVVSADHHTGGLKLAESIQKEFVLLTPAMLDISAARDSEEAILSKMAAKSLLCTETEKAELHKILQIANTTKKTAALNVFLGRVINRYAGISWTTRGHTADEVYLFAIGKSAEQFAGHNENSDIGAKLKAFYAK